MLPATSSDETTLLLPGSGGRRAFWGPVASRLTRGGRHEFFPWPGFGDAPPDPAIRSLDDLYAWFVARAPITTSNIVAQSMGGVLAMRFAIEHPHRVRRLVLVATSGGTRSRFGVDWRLGFRAERANVPDWFERDETSLDERLGEVRAPTLLVFGDSDPIAPVSMGAYLQSLIRGARLVVVPGGTHMMAEERPDEVAGAIDAHLSR
jgi:pimeloyl-ACP methyl ester carboxylesterase